MATAANPYRSTVWVILGEFFVIFLLALLADQGPGAGKAAIMLLVILWTIFIIIHGDTVKADLTAAGAGQRVLASPAP